MAIHRGRVQAGRRTAARLARVPIRAKRRAIQGKAVCHAKALYGVQATGMSMAYRAALRTATVHAIRGRSPKRHCVSATLLWEGLRGLGPDVEVPVKVLRDSTESPRSVHICECVLLRSASSMNMNSFGSILLQTSSATERDCREWGAAESRGRASRARAEDRPRHSPGQSSCPPGGR